MKKSIITVFLVAILVWLTAGCGGQKTPPPVSLPESSSLEDASSATEVSNFETVLSAYDPDELAVESIDGTQCSVNAQLAEDWIRSYQAGEAASLAIYYDGRGFPSSLYLLESDGSKTYTISFYSSEDPKNDAVYHSEVVIDRALDYVFGADSELELIPIVHKQKITEQSITTNASPSPEAEKIAEMIFDALPDSSKIFCNSAYLPANISVLDSMDFFYRATGTVEISGLTCLMISAYSSEAELAGGDQSGNVLAVSDDGSLCFMLNAAHGSWTFVWDKNEKRIFA